MVFYEITLVGMPRIRFACSGMIPKVEGIQNIIDHRRDLIELGFSDQPMEILSDSVRRTTPPYVLHLYMPDRRYVVNAAAEAEDAVNTMSIAVKSEGLRYVRYDLPPEKISDVFSSAEGTTFFLPEDTIFDEQERLLYVAQFQDIMQHHSAGTASEHILALSDWLEMIAMLDARFRRTVSEFETHMDSGTLYVYKAKKFICSHLGEDLYLDRIAGELGISVPYFSALFRRITGQTVTDYIGNMRCSQIREQIMRTDDSFTVICARAGFQNYRYAQRLFKKNFGVSMQRCRQLGNGLSLYHENPWKNGHIEEDIFEDETVKTGNDGI